MPLTKLPTSMFSRTSRETLAVNAAVDTFNRKKTGLDLDIVQGLIDARPRGEWASQATHILKLEMEISAERRAFAAAAKSKPVVGGGIFGASAVVNTEPTKWLEKLLPDAPLLEGVEIDGTGKQGAQGNTHKMSLPSGKKLFAKTARGADKNSAETEVEREYSVYKKFYASVGQHPNLVKVWGWADIKLGVQHDVGFIMDHIEGPDGRTFQGWLKDGWDLGYVTSAEYWSCIQYIGRCHVEVVQHLKSAGWAHNDLKPENYVVDSKTGEVIVIDLGGAGKIGESWNAVTVEYLAPEMLAGGKANKAAMGTVASDVFALGATLAHAVEAPQAFHGVARPNRGLASSATPSREIERAVDGLDAGRYKNAFQYGAQTDYTRQLERMMNSNPLEREKVIDERASNRFLYDSILSDQQARDVMKGIASHDRKEKWTLKWQAAIARDPTKKMPTLMTVDRLTLETRLKDKMRHYSGNMNYGGADVSARMSRDHAAREEHSLIEKWKDLTEVVKLINQANAFGIDTTNQRRIIRQKLNDCDKMARAISAVLGRPVVPPRLVLR